MTRQTRVALSVALVYPALMLAAAPAAGDSATAVIPGDPMRILVGTEGGLQANVGGASSNVFYPPSSDTGNAGFFLGFPAGFGSLSSGTVAGSPSTRATTAPWTQVSQGPVAGSGTTADPLTQVTRYRLDDGAGAVIDVTQAVSYVNGERRFVVAYAVRNVSQGPVQFRASTGADLYLDGSDVGVGFLSGGPPRLVGGINQVTGVSGGIEEYTASGFPPWSHFQESLYSAVFTAIGDPTGSGFSDSIDPSAVDNGVGVQWDDHYTPGAALASGATAAYALVWTFASPPPTKGETANVEPVTGTVLVALAPASGSAARAAQLKGATFVPLSQARQIPVGSFLDTSQGTVKLTSATGVGGQTQTGDFTGAIFQVLQARDANAATELRLKGGSFRGCRARRSALGPRVARRRLSRRTVRRLSATADGSFRTRGRHSSATVRGTTWITTDRCDGTLTRVTRGRVAVRDLRRRRTVIVRAGKSYLARAPR